MIQNGVGQVKICLQDADDITWNCWTNVHTSTSITHIGIQNIKNKVIYRIGKDKAYIEDQHGRRSCEFIGWSPGCDSFYDDLPTWQKLPWFRWIS